MRGPTFRLRTGTSQGDLTGAYSLKAKSGHLSLKYLDLIESTDYSHLDSKSKNTDKTWKRIARTLQRQAA